MISRYRCNTIVKKHTLNPEITILYQFHDQKALFKVPKICNISFWTENDPAPLWHFSEKSSALVTRPFPKGYLLTQSTPFTTLWSNAHTAIAILPQCSNHIAIIKTIIVVQICRKIQCLQNSRYCWSIFSCAAETESSKHCRIVPVAF